MFFGEGVAGAEVSSGCGHECGVDREFNCVHGNVGFDAEGWCRVSQVVEVGVVL